MGITRLSVMSHCHYPEYMRALEANGTELVIVPQARAIDEWPDGSCGAPKCGWRHFRNGYRAVEPAVGAEDS